MDIYKNTKITFKRSFGFPCSYIKGNIEKRLYIDLNNSSNDNLLISELTRNGFRRNLDHMYIPICEKCSSCISSRINVMNFKFTKSSKRNLNLNKGLKFRQEEKKFVNKRFNLFKKYSKARHLDGQMHKMRKKEFENFLYNKSCKQLVFDLFDSWNVLYGSILVDVLEDGYSAVYSFYDPDYKNFGLGKNLILRLLENLKKKELPYLYLGYWVKNSTKMDYKITFNSVEFFFDGKWTIKNDLVT